VLDENFMEKLLGRDGSRTLTVKEAEVESNARRTSLFNAFDHLQKILDRFEELIRKRWKKKSGEQRKLILREAWPGLSRAHRPDFHALRREHADQLQFKEAYLWPHMNQEDLSRGGVLLHLLHARGRNPPSTFLHADLESTHVGRETRNLVHAALPANHFVSFKGTTFQTYGRIVKSLSSVDWFSGENMLAADGMDVLEIQEKVMKFLVTICQIILKDKGDDLIGPHLVLPRATSLKDNDTEWRSIPALALQAPYNSPRSVDIHRLKYLVETRLHASKDHLFSIREDPEYFADSIKEWSDHQCIWILDQDKKPGPEPSRAVIKSQLWDSMVPTYIQSAYEDTFWWTSLLEQLDKIIGLDRTYVERGLRKEEDLPGYVDELQRLKIMIIRPIELWNYRRLSVNYPASPGFRNNFYRTTDRDRKVMLLKPRREDDSETNDYLVWLLNRLHDPKRVHVCGIQNLTLEIERLVQTNPREKERVSPFLMDLLSDIHLVSQLYHQLEIYRPRVFDINRGSKVLGHREGALLDTWAKDIEVPLQQIHNVLMDGSRTYDLGRTGNPTTGNFYYPNTKRRTEENVADMQKAERHLDSLWAKVDALLERKLDRMTHQTFKALTPDLRDLERTEDWHEPMLKPPKLKLKLHVQDFKALDDERRQRTESTTWKHQGPDATAKTKTKTRGVPREEVAQDEGDYYREPAHEVAPPVPVFNLNKRAFKVIDKLFHNSDSPNQSGELLWSDFLYAMAKIGFAIEKLYGSVWDFSLTDTAGQSRSIEFHDPHPHVKVPSCQARRIGRRLNRKYKWTSANFVPE
jgi:hypothetical protein